MRDRVSGIERARPYGAPPLRVLGLHERPIEARQRRHLNSSAAYADLLVSDDGDLARTVKVIDEMFPIQTFEELRASLRRGRCGRVADCQ